jgi:membrane protein implicated in regulation of membrane protease activity
MTLSSLFTALGALVLGVVLIVVARWAARRRGTRWDSFVALRVGDVLVTEVVGAFLVGYAIGAIAAPPGEPVGRPAPGGGRFARPGGPGPGLPFTLGIVAALIAAIRRLDLRDLALSGRASRNPIATYIGWDARVIARIPAGGWGEIALRDGSGNVMSVAATAATDVAVGTQVVISGIQGRDVVVTPKPLAPADDDPRF